MITKVAAAAGHTACLAYGGPQGHARWRRDSRIRSESEADPALPCSPGPFAVRAGQEALVEVADHMEVVSPAKQVRCRRKALRVDVLALLEAGEILVQACPCPASGRLDYHFTAHCLSAAGAGERHDPTCDPVRIGDAISIGEREYFGLRPFCARIPRGIRAGSAAADHPGGKPGLRKFQWRSGAVVDDDDLQPVTRVCLQLKRVDTAQQANEIIV